MKPSYRSAALAVTAAGCAVAFSLQGTQAAFTAETTAAAGFTAGNVTITDDDAGVAMFDVPALAPNSSGSKCIAVTYAGSIGAEVRLWGTMDESDMAGDGAELDDNVEITLDYDTLSNGGFGGCGDFTSEGRLFTGTMRTFFVAHSGFGNGKKLGTAAGAAWTPAKDEKRWFLLSYNLPGTAPNNMQGDYAKLTLHWEAQST